MKRIPLVAAVVVGLGVVSSGWSYDRQMARSYAELFAPATGAGVGKALHFVKPDAFVEGILAGKDIVAIDVRTPAETRLYTVTLPNSLAIPVARVFLPANLDRIPQDKQVVIICKSGARAAAVGTALRHIGFDNVHILKGGFKALVAYYGAREANPEPGSGGDTR